MAVRTRRPAEERRREVLDAALDLFAERGFDETSVESIASAAGVATGTVYLYFRSKEHVLQALHDESEAELDAVLAEVAQGLLEEDGKRLSLAAAIDAFVDATAAYMRQNRQKCEVVHRYIPRLEAAHMHEHHDTSMKLLIALLEEGKRRGFADVVHPDMAARLIAVAVNDTFGEVFVHGDDEEFDRLLEQTKEFIRKAIAPSKKRKA